MKRFTSYLPIVLLFVVAALLSSCERDMNEFNDDPYDASKPISFITEIGDMATRGTPVNNAAELVSMGVFCAATGLEDWSGTATANKMFNERLNHNSGTWTYHNSNIYWGATDITERYSFFAYTPYASTDNGMTVNGSSSTQGVPTLTYTVPNDVTKQPDLMLAVPRYNIRPTGGKVALAMKHALTCVGFQIMGDEEQLTAISISGVSVSGDIIMDGSNIEWTNLGSPTNTDFSASINYDMGEDYFTLSPVMTNLLSADGYLMMIPQALGSNAKIKLTFKDNTTREISLDNFTWEAGKRITYNVSVIPEGTIIVTPDNVLLPYTAQHPASESLSVICQKNDGSPNPIAPWTLISSQPWLTLSLNSDGSAAAATITGRGSQTVYLVAGQNDTDGLLTSAIFLNSVDGNPVVNVTQKVNLDNIPPGGTWVLPNSFVGAFWRANERGERIIRINNSGEWTALVTWMDGRWNAGDIVLDATPLTSNDYTNRGITWNASTENPKDADLHGFFVNGNAQSVSGTGNIFFRIGLKQKFSDLPSCSLSNPNYITTFPARYAVVLITHDEGVQKLFLRQGEGDDYVMRPEDAVNSGGYSNSQRPSAVRFSPYNLTATTLAGSTQWVQIDAARSNAAFTDFPTKAGALFQWANPFNIRYAYNAFTTSVSPWNGSGYPNDYWDALAATREVCPPGYRHPTDGVIDAYVPDHGLASTQTDNNIIHSEMRQSLWTEPQSGNYSNKENHSWGYYADGWFDRREIITTPGWASSLKNTVSAANHDVAFFGSIFFNPATNASLFFPAPGSRHYAAGAYSPASVAIYRSSSALNDKDSWVMYAGSYGGNMGTTFQTFGFSVRCVKGPPVPTLSVNPSTLTFEYDASSGQSVTVTTNQSSWSAASNQSWASVSPSSGVNGQTFTVTVANNIGASRSATITVSAGNLTKEIALTQKVNSGWNDRITVSGTGDNAKLVLTSIPTDPGVFFKFGSVVSVAYSSAVDNSAYVFNPLSNPAAITGYGNNSGILPAVPAFTEENWDAGIRNVSLNNYHNLANVQAGKGDPCRLIGMTAGEIRGFQSDTELYAREAALKAEGIGGWKLPTIAMNEHFSEAAGLTFAFGANAYSGVNGIFFRYGTTNNHFLPAAGDRTREGDLTFQGSYGSYWSNEPVNNKRASFLIFDINSVNPDDYEWYNSSISVRCVRQ